MQSQTMPAADDLKPDAGISAFAVVKGSAFYRALPLFLTELPRDYIGTLAQVQQRHGELVHWKVAGGALNFAFISDAAANRELYIKNADALRKHPAQVQTFLFAAGPSVATAHGPVWRRKRKEANALFARRCVEAPCAGQVESVRRFAKRQAASPQNGNVLARRLAAVTSSRGILGREITEQEADRQIAFSRAAADRFNVESGQILARPHWTLAPWRRDLAARRREAFAIVDRANADLRRSGQGNDGLMNHYVNGDFTTSNDAEMRSILVGLLMGAQDNVAAAVGWLLAYVAQAPDLQAQLRDEVAQVGARADDLDKCALLEAVIKEVLRIRPPAPANQPRVLTRPVMVAGHLLPKRCFVFNSIFNLHHDPKVFPDPEHFDPGRFLRGDLAKSPNFAPFGHGPRNCVAQAMAQQQLAAILVGVLQGHRLIMAQTGLPAMTQQPFLTPADFALSILPL